MPHGRATPSPLFASLAAAALALAAAGCDLDTGAMAANESIFAGFQPIKPAQAAIWASDPYDPDKRFRGLTMLANAPFGGEDVYVKMYRMTLGAPPADKVDDDAGVRGVAARALGFHGEPKDTALIAPLLKEKDRRVRLEAVRALQRLHNPEVIGELIALTNSQNEQDKDVRAEAADALGQYPEQRVAQALISALDDDEFVVTDRARRSLTTLTGQDLGEDQGPWVAFFKDNPAPFAGRRAYVYPYFHRDKIWWEYIPLWPPPPNEQPGQPTGVGAPPGAG